MFRKFRYIVFLVLFSGFAGSCSDWLELSPPNAIISEDFWKTKEDVKSAVMACYASLEESENVGSFFFWGEVRGEFVEKSTSTNTDLEDLLYGDLNQKNTFFKWGGIYQTINLCNTVLENAPGVLATDPTFTRDELNFFKAEVLTIRSLMYFLLVRSFKDVPLMLEAVSSDEQSFDIAKSPESVVLDTIVKNLEWSVNYTRLSFGSTADDAIFNKARVTRYAVYALLADIYLWRNQYQKCIDACNAVINSNMYSLVEPDRWFIDLFTRNLSEYKCPESIWQLPYLSDDNLTAPFYKWFHLTTGNKYFRFPESMIKFWDGSDFRGEAATYNVNNPDVAIPLYLVNKYLGSDETTYDEPDLRGASDPQSFYYYRYADVLLMKAEAIIETGDTALIRVEAVEKIINRQIRNRIINPQASDPEPINIEIEDVYELEKLVLQERAKELAWEGKRWFDVLRFTRRYIDNPQKPYPISKVSNLFINDMVANKFGGGSIGAQMRAVYANPGFFFNPIYEKELDYNKLLVQNEYFKE